MGWKYSLGDPSRGWAPSRQAVLSGMVSYFYLGSVVGGSSRRASFRPFMGVPCPNLQIRMEGF